MHPSLTPLRMDVRFLLITLAVGIRPVAAARMYR